MAFANTIFLNALRNHEHVTLFIQTDIQNGLSTQVMNPALLRLLNLLFQVSNEKI